MESQRMENIYLRKEGNKIVNSNNTYGTLSDHDWYVDLILTKSITLDGYVQINRDDFIYEIERQIINPYFYELGFFETIKQIGYNQDTLNYYYNLITNENNSQLIPLIYNSIYDFYKNSIELKSNFYNIPIAPDPITNISAVTLTNKLIEIKNNLEQIQKNFSFEQTLTGTTNSIVKTVVVNNQEEYVFVDNSPVPINTKINFYQDGKIYVADGIYKNYQVYKSNADTLGSAIKNP